LPKKVVGIGKLPLINLKLEEQILCINLMPIFSMLGIWF